jgi:hypothetical protein
VAKSLDPIKSFLKKINKRGKEKISYEDVVAIIEMIAKMHRGKKFGFMTEEDIESQVRLICIQQLRFFDAKKEADVTHHKSLERWLNKIVKNRLKNFYRDHCLSVNEKHSSARQSLSRSACSLDDQTHVADQNSIQRSTIQEDIEHAELQIFIEQRLDESYMEIYKACINDEAVTPYYKNKLMGRINEILKEWNSE